MKLRVRAEQLPPVGLRLTLPGDLASELGSYGLFVQRSGGRKMELKELAVEMLSQFLESDKDFRKFLAAGSGSGSGAHSENGAGAGQKGV